MDHQSMILYLYEKEMARDAPLLQRVFSLNHGTTR